MLTRNLVIHQSKVKGDEVIVVTKTITLKGNNPIVSSLEEKETNL